MTSNITFSSLHRSYIYDLSGFHVFYFKFFIILPLENCFTTYCTSCDYGIFLSKSLVKYSLRYKANKDSFFKAFTWVLCSSSTGHLRAYKLREVLNNGAGLLYFPQKTPLHSPHTLQVNIDLYHVIDP